MTWHDKGVLLRVQKKCTSPAGDSLALSKWLVNVV